MILRSGTARICRSCQHDLLALFEHGFCRSTRLREHLLLLRKPGQFQHPRALLLRTLSSSRVLRDDDRKTPATGFSEVSEARHENEAVDEDNAVQADLDALEQLEKRELEESLDLGGQVADELKDVETLDLEEQIADEQEGVETLDLEEQIADEHKDVETLIMEGKDPVVVLRESGAGMEAVVRQARHVFGESLPEDVLNDEEFILYRRLYGDPMEPIEEFLDEDEQKLDGEKEPNQLFGPDGEAVDYDFDGARDHSSVVTGALASQSELQDTTVEQDSQASGRDELLADPPQSASLKSLNDRATEIAIQLGGELYDPDDRVDPEDAEASSLIGHRAHPLTVIGQFSSSPRTINLPQEAFVRPVENILAKFSNKQLREVCERTFGGPGLANSPLTPRSGRSMPQVPIPLDAAQHGMGEMEANSFLSVIMPATYAAIVSVLIETRKRLGSSWLINLLKQEGGPRILDAGAGGAGVIAWREVLKAEWANLHSSDRNAPEAPLGKATVLAGADTLRHRSAELLENTTFLPRLPDYVHVRDSPTLGDDRPAPLRKQFDIVIAPHSLWPLREDFLRKHHVQNLWSLLNPDGGVLVLIEKGVPRGFEVLAGAREHLLGRFIASPETESDLPPLEDLAKDSDQFTQKGKGTIVAPCPHHGKCPMYTIPGVSRGRKDWCSFQQRYLRPSYLQRILGAKDRNHDDVDFSYLSVLKGRDLRSESNELQVHDLVHSPVEPSRKPTVGFREGAAATDMAFKGYEHVSADESLTTSRLPRQVFPPLKRKGHVTIDLCTPSGKIERWTVPKSFSRQAYRDARKSAWGDLWALGAKTRVDRSLKLGLSKNDKLKPRSQEERLKDKAAQILEEMQDERAAMEDEERELGRVVDEEIEEIMEDIDDDPVLKEWQEEYDRDHEQAAGRRSGARSGRTAKSRTKAGMSKFSSTEDGKRRFGGKSDIEGNNNDGGHQRDAAFLESRRVRKTDSDGGGGDSRNSYKDDFPETSRSTWQRKGRSQDGGDLQSGIPPPRHGASENSSKKRSTTKRRTRSPAAP